MAASIPGEAMETLKMKIFMLKKENTEESEKMKTAEKEKSEANARLQEAEKKIKELSKQIHSRYLVLFAGVFYIIPLIKGKSSWMITPTDFRRTFT